MLEDIYEDNKFAIRKNSKPFNPDDFDSNAQYMKHYENSLLISFFLQNGTTQEKISAQKQLDICSRKMKYWASQPSFKFQQSCTDMNNAKKKWKM